jgi:alanyl-tRNA synthetase
MERLTNSEYGASRETDISFRVIGDHARAAAFLIADNVHPGNEGRGYVLRRIMRRALRHGRMLGVTEPFLHTLTHTVVEIMKDAYPELVEFAPIIDRVVLAEEKSFRATLDNGMRLLDEIIADTKQHGATAITGADIFKLYDTFGFPLDLAADIATDAGLTLDLDGYNTHMKQQREKARASWKGGSAERKKLPDTIAVRPTRFVGYDVTNTTCLVDAIIVDQQPAASATVGQSVTLIFDVSPFYAESGGQVADLGIITGEAFQVKVTGVTKTGDGIWLHACQIIDGTVTVGDTARCDVDLNRRKAIMRNHSATHLLHAALRDILGGHVKQGGSMVADDRLRFDYTHFTAPTRDELLAVETLVNQQVMGNNPVITNLKSIDEAVAEGAMALFGEKYGDTVRVVTMGDFSMELCGGTHATATGDIGLFKITSESAVAAGLRRIEAVTGNGALNLAQSHEAELLSVADQLKAPIGELHDRVQRQIDRVKELEKENAKLKEKLVMGGGVDGGSETQAIAGVTVVAKILDSADSKTMRMFVDDQKNRLGSAIIAVGAVDGEKVLLTVGVTDDLSKQFPAGAIIKQMAAMVGGGGGDDPTWRKQGGKSRQDFLTPSPQSLLLSRQWRQNN